MSFIDHRHTHVFELTAVAVGMFMAIPTHNWPSPGYLSPGASEMPRPAIGPQALALSAGALTVKQLAAGGYSAYALLSDGTVWAWGDNIEGQLGNGTDGTAVDVPERVLHLSGAQAVAASANSAFALRGDGSVWAWGDDGQGELGDGEETYTSELPVRVGNLHDIVQVVAGEFSAYALSRDGTVLAWGDNGIGQLAQNLSVTTSDVPREVKGLTGGEQLAAGAGAAYVLTQKGTVWAWGDNAFGELGRPPELIGSQAPLPVKGLTGVKAIAAGAFAGFALRADGTVLSWGDSSFGDLGRGGCPRRSPSVCPGTWAPQPVRLLTHVDAIAAGTYAVYALEANGTVWAWGEGGYGQLGDGSYLSSSVPVRVSRLRDVTAVAAGANAAYALEVNGTVWAWGNGDYGQLGDGSGGSSDVPVPVSGLAPGAAVAP